MNVEKIGFNSVHLGGYSVKRQLEKGYMLILVKSGGFFNLNGNGQHVDKNTVIIFDSTCLQDYCADGEVFIYDWLFFDTDGDGDFLESLDIPFNTLIRYSDADFISSIIRNIASEFYSFSNKRNKIIDALLKSLLIKISECGFVRAIVQQNTDPHYSALMELREKIYRTPQLKWNVDSMAADVNMSRSYFQHIYRETFGVSCISDVIAGKLEKAKELLSETSCTVSQVAAMCGYDNEEHFMRQFKKMVGMTPTSYRRKQNT